MKKNVIQLIILCAVVIAIIGGNVGVALHVPADGDDISIDLVPIETTVEGDASLPQERNR